MPKHPPEPIALSPERSALVAAHEAKQARIAERAAIAAAHDNAEAAVLSTFVEINVLEKALRERPRTAADRLVRVAGGYNAQDPEPEPESTRDLRAKLALAEDEVEDRRRTREHLAEQLQGLDRYDFTESKLKDAAIAVLRAETRDVVAQMVARIEAITIEMAQARAVLQVLQTAGIFGEFQHEVPPAVSGALSQLTESMWRIHSAARASSPWGTALAALQADPLAPLPG